MLDCHPVRACQVTPHCLPAITVGREVWTTPTKIKTGSFLTRGGSEHDDSSFASGANITTLLALNPSLLEAIIH